MIRAMIFDLDGTLVKTERLSRDEIAELHALIESLDASDADGVR